MHTHSTARLAAPFWLKQSWISEKQRGLALLCLLISMAEMTFTIANYQCDVTLTVELGRHEYNWVL